MSLTEQRPHPAIVSPVFVGSHQQRLPSTLMDHLELSRQAVCHQIGRDQRAEFGQFLTPTPVANLMASMLEAPDRVVSILDAGAGIGSLFAAVVAELCQRPQPPHEIMVIAYEIDPLLIAQLHSTTALCARYCARAGIRFRAEVRQADFIKDAADLLGGTLFHQPYPSFSAAILNPPYRKIKSNSETRRLLQRIGIETSNIYTGFVATAMKLLAPGAEMVTITPRSFCNGTYFRGFRDAFLADMTLRRVHLFDSRQEAFREDAVLQETLIVHSIKSRKEPAEVIISSSSGAEDGFILARHIAYDEVIHKDDPEHFIRVAPDHISQQIVRRMRRFRTSLVDLGLTVSTGRVVDFRVRGCLHSEPQSGAAPLVYPVNLERGGVVWPKTANRPQYLDICEETATQFIPNANYVLVKRFSPKEQNRRIVSAVLMAGQLPGNKIGLENHLNFYHHGGGGVGLSLARGLSLYLNSTLVDAFFRQFNGHTQVNATDLRSLSYPSLLELERLGDGGDQEHLSQEEIDEIIEREFFSMTDDGSSDPVATKKRLQEAVEVLSSLGLPKAQVNERSALTLLALLALTPAQTWNQASQPLRGITPMMEFMDQRYGKKYAPNSRETVRRQTIHQFLDAGLIVANPDELGRPINSGKTVYQIEISALELLRTYGSSGWDRNLQAYLASVETLKSRYAQERAMSRIPIQIAPGNTITLSPGGQNVLVEQIVSEFAPRFTPNGRLIYVGDTDEKFAYFDKTALSALRVDMDAHGKMPGVIIHYTEKDWLVLIEAVTSHGPINAKRKTELTNLFARSSAGLVLVTAFLSRKAMTQYLPEISWETEVWVAEAPTHMIHFDGERFLGPY